MGFLRKFLSTVIAYGICAVAFSVLSAGAAYAGTLFEREYQIKAAILYNFTKFVEWPADRFTDENAHIILCVIGRDPFGEILERTVKGKNSKGRNIDIKRIDEIENLKTCHLVFVGSSQQKRMRQIVAISYAASILTIGDVDDFVELGGVINLIKIANRIRFEINMDAANQAHLKLDLKLLTLASSVTKIEPIFGVPE